MALDLKAVVLSVTVLICSTAVVCAWMLRQQEPKHEPAALFEKRRSLDGAEYLFRIDRESGEAQLVKTWNLVYGHKADAK